MLNKATTPPQQTAGAADPQPAAPLPPSHARHTLFTPQAPLRLDCGRTIAPVNVAFETFGALNKQRDNTVLVCHALTGDAHCARHAPSDRPGWWDTLIGPGKPIDTNALFVVCSNVIGGCAGTTGPLSTDPATGRRYGPTFPFVTVGDMVAVQHALLESLGVHRLYAVMGGSLGGMQALEWSLRFTELVDNALIIASAPRLSAQAIAFNAIGRNAILVDPAFEHGWYPPAGGPRNGLAVARQLAHVTYRSAEAFERRFGRGLRHRDELAFTNRAEFSVETYLEHKGARFVERFDANSYLRLTRAMDYYNAATARGSLAQAFRRAHARYLVVSFESDWLFPPQQSEEVARAARHAGRHVTHANFAADDGHDSFLLPHPGLEALVQRFLAADPREPSATPDRSQP